MNVDMYTHSVFLLYHTVAGVDYIAVVDEPLQFMRGQISVCHDVQITQDDICEIDPRMFEHFFSNLAYVIGIMPITIDPPRTRVIINDTNEPECRKYVNNLHNAQCISIFVWRILYTEPLTDKNDELHVSTCHNFLTQSEL